MADDVVNENPVPTADGQPAPGETPDGHTDGPHPTPEGTPENVNTTGDAPAEPAAPATPAGDSSGVQTSDDLR